MIVSLFESDGRSPEVAEAEQILRRLVTTLDRIDRSVTLGGAAVSRDTLLDTMLAAHRLSELLEALTAGVLPESVVPDGLQRGVGRLLLVLTSAERAVPLRPDVVQLVLSVADGRTVTGRKLATLLTEAVRVLDAWLDTVPESALSALPPLGPLDPDSAPASLPALLWRLLAAGDGSQPAPLVPVAGRSSPQDGSLLESSAAAAAAAPAADRPAAARAGPAGTAAGAA